MRCSVCGTLNDADAPYCQSCGTSLGQRASFEPRCARHPEVVAQGPCTRCGTFGCASCLTPQGSGRVCPSCASASQQLPWDERQSLGVFRAWWRTATMMLRSPSQTLRTAEPSAPLGSSVLFAAVSALVGAGPSLLVFAVVMAVVMGAGLASRGDSDLVVGGLGVGAAVGLAFGYLVMLVAFQAMAVLAYAGVQHLGLKLAGAAPKPFEVTARAYALSTSPMVLGLMPVCGLYVFPLWSLVLQVVSLSALHKTSGGKAAFAVFAPAVLLCGCIGGFYVLVFGVAALSAAFAR